MKSLIFHTFIGTLGLIFILSLMSCNISKETIKKDLTPNVNNSILIAYAAKENRCA